MYVIGVNEWDFLNIKSRTMMVCESCVILNEIEKVIYGCSLWNATIFSDYENAAKIVEKIKESKNDILFENDSIIGQILDKEKMEEFDVNALKVYELVPTECKGME